MVSKYPKIIRNLEEKKNLFTFFNFPEAIRRSIYLTNLIESFNKMIKRKTKRKEQFPNEESLERFVLTEFIATDSFICTKYLTLP